MFDIGALFFSACRCRFLKPVAGANNNAAIGKTLEAHKSASVDARLPDIRLGEIDRFNSNVQLIVHIVTDARVELSSILLNHREAPGEAGSTAES